VGDKPHRNHSDSRRRLAHDAPTQTVVVLPGASLMTIQTLAPDMTLVRCPACGATKALSSGSEGGIIHIAFVHEDDACPILRRIQAALRLCAEPSGGVQ
jgi:hypothetical protein